MKLERKSMMDNHIEVTLRAHKHKSIQTYMRIGWLIFTSIAVYKWAVIYHFTEKDKYCFVSEQVQYIGGRTTYNLVSKENFSAEDINVSGNFEFIARIMYAHAIMMFFCCSY